MVSDNSGTTDPLRPHHLIIKQGDNLTIDFETNERIVDYSYSLFLERIAKARITSFAGSNSSGSSDGQRDVASFNNPSAIAIDLTGNIFIADSENHKIRKIDQNGISTTWAGSGVAGSIDAQSINSSFNHPQGIAIDSSGNIFVADTKNHNIRKIDTSGNVTTYSGTGSPAQQMTLKLVVHH